ncbi:MAG: phage major capsid protein [Candidatus Cloacimonetes bacterium]|nr:phage major capsid protein [Candidatus Cloacimonadota bacterium]
MADIKLTAENIAEAIANGNKSVMEKIIDEIGPITEELKKQYERIEDLAKTQNKLATAKAEIDQNKFKSFGEQLSEVALSSVKGELTPKLKAIHNLDDAHLGSFLIQDEFANDLSKGMFETGILTNKVKTIETSKNMLNINSLKEASRVSGSRLGGLISYWEAEQAEATVTNASFKRQTLTLDKLMGSFKATEEMLEDAPFLESYIKSLFMEEFGFQLDLAILKGTGSGAPLGILNSDCLLTQTKDAAISVDELFEMENKVLKRTGAEWFVNRSVLPGLRALKVNINFYAFTGQGLHGLPTDQLLGKVLTEVEQLPVNSATANSILLANMDEYTIFKKAGGVKTASSIHVNFLQEINTFRFSLRVTGRPNYDEVITLADGTTQVSPFVTTV